MRLCILILYLLLIINVSAQTVDNCFNRTISEYQNSEETALESIRLVPGFNTTGHTQFRVYINPQQNGINQIEFEAIKVFYESTNGDNWTNNSNWNTALTACDVSNDWYGLTIEGGHVVNLNLNNNNLNGFIPMDINSLVNLTELSASNNQLTDLPNLSGLNLTSLQVQNNALTFEDIEPNIDISGISYYPQAKVGEVASQQVEIGSDYTLSISVDGENNSYQWYKDGSIIDGAATANYTISSFSETDAGVYHCEITNSVVTELTLQLEDITLTAGASEPIIVSLPGIEGLTGGTITHGSSTTNLIDGGFSFTPNQLPVSDVTMELIDGSGGTIPTMLFDIEENGDITNVRMVPDDIEIPMPDSFYDTSNGLTIEHFECVSVYSED